MHVINGLGHVASGRWRLTTATLAVAFCAVLLSATSGPAAADSLPAGAGTQDTSPAISKAFSDQILCPVDELLVPEDVGSGVVSEWLSYGESLEVTPYDDQIWAGIWFTGTNGPDGWSGTSASSAYPLPGAPEYSLIARIGNNPYEYVGSAQRSFTNNRPGYRQRVRFRVNDNTPGNGSGAFRVFLRYPCHEA